MSEDTTKYRAAAAAAPVGPVPMADPDAFLASEAAKPAPGTGDRRRWHPVGTRCQCGAQVNPASAAWRWQGLQWEHWCQPPPKPMLTEHTRTLAVEDPGADHPNAVWMVPLDVADRLEAEALRYRQCLKDIQRLLPVMDHMLSRDPHWRHRLAQLTAELEHLLHQK